MAYKEQVSGVQGPDQDQVNILNRLKGPVRKPLTKAVLAVEGGLSALATVASPAAAGTLENTSGRAAIVSTDQNDAATAHVLASRNNLLTNISLGELNSEVDTSSFETRELIGPQDRFNPIRFINPGEGNLRQEIYDSTIRAGVPTEITGAIAFRPSERTPQGDSNITGIILTDSKELISQDENALLLYRLPRNGSLILEHRYGGQPRGRFPIGFVGDTLEDFTISISDDGLNVRVTTSIGTVEASLTESLFARDSNLRLMAITNGYAHTEIPRLVITQAPTEESIFPFPQGESLRTLAERRNISIGTTAPTRRRAYDWRYERILAHEFNHMTSGFDVNLSTVHPAQDVYNFGSLDQLVNFAHRNGMEVRNLTLIWGHEDALPQWLKEGNFTRDEYIKLMQDHITEVMTHYKGIVSEWIPVNEAVEEDGRLRNNFWLQKIGPEYIELAFQAARRANPDAILIYNDYGNHTQNPKTDKIIEMTQQVNAKGRFIDGIGMQMHLLLRQLPRIEDVRATMRRYQNLWPLEPDTKHLYITEADFDMAGAQGSVEEKQRRKGEAAGNIVDLALEFGLPSLTLWGFERSTSWLFDWGRDPESPHLFDDYIPNYAYFGTHNALSGTK